MVAAHVELALFEQSLGDREGVHQPFGDRVADAAEKTAGSVLFDVRVDGDICIQRMAAIGYGETGTAIIVMEKSGQLRCASIHLECAAVGMGQISPRRGPIHCPADRRRYGERPVYRYADRDSSNCLGGGCLVSNDNPNNPRISVRSRISGFSAFVLFVGLSVYTIGAWTTIDAREIDPAFGRAEFARTTMDGIKENWVTGVGFGNFQKAYQIYEKEGMIFRAYANHAHNEYLEITFDGGVIAAILVDLYLCLILFAFARIRQYSFQKAAFLSVVFLLVHSLVDYPLRTAALAMTFAYMNAIIFHRGIGERMSQKPEQVEVDHNGDKLFVPVGASP